jgi:hypothetical protein
MPKSRSTPCRAIREPRNTTQKPQPTVNFELLNLEADVVKTAEWVAHAWRTERRDSVRMSMLLQELNRTVEAVEQARSVQR